MKTRELVSKILRYGLVFSFFALVGFAQAYYLPRLKTWILTSINLYSAENLPVHIRSNDLSVSLWPIGLAFEKVTMHPRGDLAKTMGDIDIKEVRVGINFAHLVMGNFRISEMIVRGATVNVILHASQKADKANDKALEIPLEKIYRLPIDQFTIEHLTLKTSIEEKQLSTQIADLNLSIKNKNKSLLLTLTAPDINLIRKNYNQNSIHFSLDVKALIESESIQISGIKIYKDNAFLVASGSVKGDISKLNFSELNFRSRVDTTLEKLNDWISTLNPELHLPKISGSLKTDLAFNKTREMSLIVQTQFEDLKIDEFQIGSLKLKGTTDFKKIQLPLIEIKNNSGSLRARDAMLTLDENMNVGAHLDVSGIDLKHFLMNLGLPEIPVELNVTANLPCSGLIKPSLDITCKGTMTGTDFSVLSTGGEKQIRIAAFDKMTADGEVRITNTAVYPKAQLTIGNSKGSAEGHVSYSDGFQFKYHTDSLDFKDLKSLAELKFEGKLALDGSTEGDSHHGMIDMNISSTGLWFENYGVGSATAKVNYKEGYLSFQDLKGQFNDSRYKGNVKINLSESKIEAAVEIPYMETHDLQEIFSRVAPLPFEAYGTGFGKLKVSGPLEFNKLTYNLESEINKGVVWGETFDQAHFNVESKNGYVVSKRIDIKKGKGYASMEGKGYPDGNINTVIHGNHFLLEDFEMFGVNRLNMKGVMDLEMTMKDHVLKPTTSFQAKISQNMIGPEQMPDSKITLKFTPNTVEGSGNLFANKISLDFIFPTKETAPFLFKAKTNGWDFSPLFYSLAPNNSKEGYFTELTSDIDLSAPSGGFWNSTGHIAIQQFLLNKNDQKLFTQEPIQIHFTNGKMNADNFNISGTDSYLKIQAKNSHKNNLNMNLNGKLNLSTLSFLTPFFQDFKGKLAFSTQITGTHLKPEMMGSAFVEDGYIRLADFPHPFEKIKVDALFNENKIILNNIETSLASGNAYAAGTLAMKGFKNFPAAIQGTFENVNFQIPDGVKTQGSGHFAISGSWFPFLLTGVYNVKSGQITRNFNQDSRKDVVKKSEYLPETVKLNDESEVLKFDINCVSEGPVEIKNEMMDAQGTGSLQLKGSNKTPVLLGHAQAKKGGKLFFRDTPFEITTADVKFTNPKTIFPEIYATGTTRLKNYEINLLFQGNPSKYNLSLSSAPVLPENDIISLLALGVTSSKLEEQKTENQQDMLAYQIGSAILSQNPIGKEIKNKTGFDVKISSTIDDTKNTAAPKIAISKQWTPKVTTSASRTLGTSVTQDVTVEYELQRNLYLIGNWEGKQYEEETSSNRTNRNTDVLGLDLQYKVEFK